MAKPGRRPDITPELTATIVTKITSGAFPTVAAESSGVGHSTFMRWLQRGRKKTSPKVYRDFRDAIDQARAKACHDAESRVFTESPLDWLRRGPGRERWGDKTEIEISGNRNRPLRIDSVSPFSIGCLAESQVILADLGIIPQLPDDARTKLITYGQEEIKDEADPESQQETTGTPEWMKRKAVGGRKCGSKKKKPSEVKKTPEAP